MEFFAAKLNHKDMTRNYRLEPLKMVEAVVKFVIDNRFNPERVDECFKPNLKTKTTRLTTTTAEELMKDYWGTKTLKSCDSLRKTAVELYLNGKKKNVPDRLWDNCKGKTVAEVAQSDVDVIVGNYLTTSKFHYERVFTNKFLKGITAVLVQKVWSE